MTTQVPEDGLKRSDTERGLLPQTQLNPKERERSEGSNRGLTWTLVVSSP